MVATILSNPIKDQFPALDQMVSGHPLAYLDSAATTQRPVAVLEAMEAFYRHDNSNVHRGVHSLSVRATDHYDDARRQIARFVNASVPEEIVFTKGCTEAVNLVAQAWGRQNLTQGDVIAVSEMDHHSNIVPWQVIAEATGASIEPISVTQKGELDISSLRAVLATGKVKLVAFKHVCNAIGTVNPVSEVAELVRTHGATTLVDGAQALAHIDVDVQALGVDFYAMAGHKVYGPMGIGALFARKELLEAMAPYQVGGGMIQRVTLTSTTYAPVPEKFEPGTPNVPGAIGFAAALDWLSDSGKQRLWNLESELAHQARERLQSINGLRVIGSARETAPIVSFVMEDAHPHDIGTVMDSEGVAIRAGHHCCQPLMDRMGVGSTARASFAAYSTQEDVDALIRGAERVVEIFGGKC